MAQNAPFITNLLCTVVLVGCAGTSGARPPLAFSPTIAPGLTSTVLAPAPPPLPTFDSSRSTPTPLPTLTSRIAGMPEPGPEELVERADLIVLGTVVSPQVSAFSEPEAPALEKGAADYRTIYTETPVRLERLLKGHAREGHVLVRTIGGQVGDVAMHTTHEPQLRVGQHVLLFLKHAGTDSYTILGEVGAYEILDDDAFAGLLVDPPHIGHRMWLPLDELLTRIENVAR